MNRIFRFPSTGILDTPNFYSIGGCSPVIREPHTEWVGESDIRTNKRAVETVVKNARGIMSPLGHVMGTAN